MLHKEPHVLQNSLQCVCVCDYEILSLLLLKMDIFLEVKCIFHILCFMAAFESLGVNAVQLECIKSDVCSCKTNSKPQQEMSLWPIPSGNGIDSSTSSWRYDINLCHGLNKNTNTSEGGCQNSTVCQYSEKRTFEIGHFGNVTFGNYDNETKSIILLYYGILQKNATRSIKITLKCDEDGNITKAKYTEVKPNIFSANEFTTMIITKASCLRPVVAPKPTTKPTPKPTSKPTTSKPATSKTKPTTLKPTTSKPPTSKTKPITSKHTTSKPTSKPSSKPSNSTLKPTAHKTVTSNGGLKTVYTVLITVAVMTVCFLART